ncbi:MAG: 3-deoxy-manno-octulosonate cytidylyltransferase [Fimbriimonadia bacterium]|jgi:3-deoxy-manno-octulosonate cytidylyltransferase (CMP-KDO synthetase)
MAYVVAVIPARMGSTRFPGKPLAQIAGKPMLQHVWERVVEARVVDEVYISSPDPEILEAAARFGADAVPSNPACPTGTDRVAEVAASTLGDIYINVQGDEPLIRTQDVEAVMRPMLRTHPPDSASLCCPCTLPEETDPNVVKVVLDVWGYALYFSRSQVPYPRSRQQRALRHLGVYAFNRDTIMQFPHLKQTPLEKAEGLEQLRLLEHGYTMALTRVRRPAGPAVDTPEQLAEVERLLSRGTR